MYYNLPQGFSNITQSNYTNIVYISGDETTEDSIRLAITEDGIAKVQKLTNTTWQDTGIRLSGESLYLGRDLSITAFGNTIGSESNSSRVKHLVLQNRYDDTGSGEIVVPKLSSKIIKEIVQSNEDGSSIGTEYSYTFTVSESIIVDKIYYKFGDIVPASSELNIIVYNGIDDTGDKYFEQKLPACFCLANSECEIELSGGLGYNKNQNIFIKITSEENFEIITNLSGTSPYRAYDYWSLVLDSSMSAPLWSAKDWSENDWCIDSGFIYVCNTTGAQSGSFASNIVRWDKLNAMTTESMVYKGGITVAAFNTLTSGLNGDYYRFTDSGTLVGGESASVGDSAIVNNDFSVTITASDYDYFKETLNGDVFYQIGRAGGQTAAGGNQASENLVITSTTDATKGNVTLGDSVYDETNDALGINGNPDDSAILTLTSTDRGLLPPRMTKSERDLITAPATGLIIYQTDTTQGLYHYNGTSWESVNTPNGFDEYVFISHIAPSVIDIFDSVAVTSSNDWDVLRPTTQCIEIADTNNALNRTLNGFTAITNDTQLQCDVAGTYKIDYNATVKYTSDVRYVYLQLAKNTTLMSVNSTSIGSYSRYLFEISVSGIFTLDANDTIDIRLGANYSTTYGVASDNLTITRIK